MKKGYVFGDFQTFYRVPSTEEIEMAKEKVVEDLCEEIRRLSREYPEEFFILNATGNFVDDETIYTVGAKLIAPTITNKE